MSVAEVQNEPWIPGGVSEPMSWDPVKKLWVPSPPAPGSIDASSLAIPQAHANSLNVAPATTVTVISFTGGSIFGSSRFTLNANGVVVPQTGVYTITGILLTTGVALSTTLRATLLVNGTQWAQQDGTSEMANIDICLSNVLALNAGDVIGMSVVATVAGGSVASTLYVALLGAQTAS